MGRKRYTEEQIAFAIRPTTSRLRGYSRVFI